MNILENILANTPFSIGQGDSLEDMTSDATAVSEDILDGKTAYVKGELVTGTHECATLAEMTADATAKASEIVSGKTAYVKGNKVTGSHTCSKGTKVTIRTAENNCYLMYNNNMYYFGDSFTVPVGAQILVYDSGAYVGWFYVSGIS